jgi:transcriptional regulator GlxA family with amidase domain
MAEPRIIAALVYPDVQLLDVVGPLEAFNLASQQLLDNGETRQPAYRVQVIAAQAQATRSMSGLQLAAHRDMQQPLDDVDTLIIPGGLTGGHRFYEDAANIRWVQQAAPRVRRLCSVCSGALLLAAAGLLEGKRATTHWMDADQLRECYPGVRVEANRIFLRDGRIYTSGGITAGIDLALALVEQDHSRRLALQVARRMLVYLKRPGGQSQFSTFLAAQARPGPFEAMLDWISEHLQQPLDTASLAAKACMSERSFQRRFEAAHAMPVQAYLRRARVNKAQALLESGATPLARIARSCGFASVDAMRYAFHKELGVTPSAYRQRFGNQR